MLYDFNWKKVIESLPLDQGESKTPDSKFYLNTDGRFDKIIAQWKDAGYDKIDSVEWINYYPGKHYDNSVIENFSKWSNTICARSWISRIRPGKMAPWHQDVDDHLEKYLEVGELIRFSVFISEPSLGAIFLLKDTAYHLQPEGSVVKWDHYMDWHAGANCGFKDKFMFHFLGVKNDQ